MGCKCVPSGEWHFYIQIFHIFTEFIWIIDSSSNSFLYLGILSVHSLDCFTVFEISWRISSWFFRWFVSSSWIVCVYSCYFSVSYDVMCSLSSSFCCWNSYLLCLLNFEYVLYIVTGICDLHFVDFSFECLHFCCL